MGQPPSWARQHARPIRTIKEQRRDYGTERDEINGIGHRTL